MKNSNSGQIFYHTDISENCILSPEESNHAIRVLRLKMGDELNLFDGKGGLYKAIITDANPQKCIVKISAKLPDSILPTPIHLHLAVAPTKNIERYEWFLEKAVEIGISEITPLICGHSERRILKTDRLEKILISAMKQSLNLFLPKLNNPENFANFVTSVKLPSDKREYQKFIAHCLPKQNHLKNIYSKGADVVILIGPEGDFSEEEIKLAEENGFMKVSLGKSRLRTETAAIAACHTINLLNEN